MNNSSILAERYHVSPRTIFYWKTKHNVNVSCPKAVATHLVTGCRPSLATLESVIDTLPAKALNHKVPVIEILSARAKIKHAQNILSDLQTNNQQPTN